MQSRRRYLLTSAGVVAVALSGCSGDEETSDGESERTADGVVGEPVEKGPVTVTFDRVAAGTTYSGGTGETVALTGSQFIGYEVTVEVTGETSVEVRRAKGIGANYLGTDASTVMIQGDAQVAGTSLRSWREDFGRDRRKELSPGDSVSGNVVAVVPDSNYQPADVVLTYTAGDTTVRVRGGDGDPRQPYTPPSPAPGTYSFGERINDAGVKYTVTGYSLADSIGVPSSSSTATPESEDLQFIVLSFELENVSPVVRSIISRPELRYAGEEGRSHPISETLATREFETGGDTFMGWRATGDTRGNNETDGAVFYPTVTLTRALVYQVPRQFDDSNIEVVMSSTPEIIFAP